MATLPTEATPENLSATRWWRLIRPGRRLRCPHDHALGHNFRITESGAIRCEHWIASEKRHCAAWVWIVPIRGGAAFVIQVNGAQEVDHVDAQHSTSPAAILEYFGIFDAIEQLLLQRAA